MLRVPSAPLRFPLVLGAGVLLAECEVSIGQTTPLRSGDSPRAPKALVDVLTHHKDPSRTGANLQQRYLMPENVNSKTFGRLLTEIATQRVHLAKYTTSRSHQATERRIDLTQTARQQPN